MLEATVQFQTWLDVSMLYAVKQDRARKFEDAFWKSSATAPCKDFLARSGLEPNKNLVGQKLFGFQRDAVKELGDAMREQQPE